MTKTGNNKFLLTGGIQKPNANDLGHGHGMEYAQLSELDWQKKSIRSLLKIKTDPQFCADDEPSVYFTSATLVRDTLCLCSTTQIFIYDFPSLTLRKTINHRLFNDIHHVTAFEDNIVVVSTGLDLVLFFNQAGQIQRVIHVLDQKNPESLHNNINYQKIASTKPHLSHPNFVFTIDGEPWVTRFEQRDAISLVNKNRRIDIGIEKPHDGHVVDDFIYFSTVDGHIVVVNKNTLKKETVYNLNEFDSRGCALGWCRSLCFIDPENVFVGFSMIRPTNFRKNIRWIKSMLKNFRAPAVKLPTRVAQYNLKTKKLIDEFVIPQDFISLIFSIIAIDDCSFKR